MAAPHLEHRLQLGEFCAAKSRSLAEGGQIGGQQLPQAAEAPEQIAANP
jgi:hypothetical protein